MIEVFLAAEQLCVQEQCHQIVVGCPATPTPTGVFKISTIFTRPLPVSPHGVRYPGSKLGNIVIELQDRDSDVAWIHGWNDQSIFNNNSDACSWGCLRLPQGLLEDLTYNYYFNKIKINS